MPELVTLLAVPPNLLVHCLSEWHSCQSQCILQHTCHWPHPPLEPCTTAYLQSIILNNAPPGGQASKLKEPHPQSGSVAAYSDIAYLKVQLEPKRFHLYQSPSSQSPQDEHQHAQLSGEDQGQENQGKASLQYWMAWGLD